MTGKSIALSNSPPLAKHLSMKRREDIISTSPENSHTSQIEETPEEALPMQCCLELRRIKSNRKRSNRAVTSREEPVDNLIGERRSERLRKTTNKANSREQANMGEIHNYADHQTLDNQLYPSASESETETSERRNSTEENHLGEMSAVCQFCSARFFKEESSRGKYTKCCNQGKVALESLAEVPPILRELLNGCSDRSRRFIKNARAYNNSLSLASMGVNFRRLNSRGPSCLTVNGRIMHYGIPLYAEKNMSPRFAQLYFIEPNEAINLRAQRGNGTDPEVMTQLAQYLKANNILVQSYTMLEEKIVSEKESTGIEPDDVVMWFVNDSRYVESLYRGSLTAREAPVPICNEVAIVFSHRDGQPDFHRDLRIYPRGANPEIMNQFTSICDPMSYILLFPSGSDRGWSIRRRKDSGVTLMDFYSYRMAIRGNDFNILHRAGDLSGQFWIDAYMKYEANNLKWYESNQTRIRAETYVGLHDYINNRTEEIGGRPGRRVILPSTFSGSNRNMYFRYLDSMALVQKFTKPDLFITMTTNPHWKDIQENLMYPEQDPFQRWDLLSRVFSSCD